MMGRGVRAASVRPGASCCLIKMQSPSSLPCYRFLALGNRWPWGVPAQYRRNGQVLRDPPGNNGLSCSISISKKTSKLQQLLKSGVRRVKISETQGLRVTCSVLWNIRGGHSYWPTQYLWNNKGSGLVDNKGVAQRTQQAREHSLPRYFTRLYGTLQCRRGWFWVHMRAPVCFEPSLRSEINSTTC